jgi:hypothetical protein
VHIFLFLEDFVKLSKKNCSCPQSCERILYEATLSYGTFKVGHGDDMYRAAMKANPGVPDYDQKIYARY